MRGLKYLELGPFDGGLNIRDSAAELNPNETPLAWNVTLDERGGFTPRLGITKLNGVSLLPAAPCYLYYSRVADALLAYISSNGGVGKLYKSTDGGVTWASAYALFTAGALGAIVDFKDRVVVCNTTDGVYSFPSGLGAPTHTAGGTNNMDVPKGSSIAVWQNKVWVGGLSTAGQRARLMMCAAGDELTWNSAGGTHFNDLRDVDDEPITALIAGQGLDYTAKPSLVVCKRHSVYRVNDPATAGYTTLHSKGAGAASPTAAVSNMGVLAFVNDLGVWLTDGLGEPVLVSGKIDPLFTTDGLNMSDAAMAVWSAGPLGERVVFNLTRAGSSTNDLQLEYHPKLKWIVRHKGLTLGPCAAYTKSARKLIAASATTGKVYEVDKGGTDDGTAIDCAWQSPWFPLNDGADGRVRRLRMWGRGIVSAFIKTDFTTGAGDQTDLDFSESDAFLWDTGAWDTGLWGDRLVEGAQDVYSDAVGRHVSIGIKQTVTTTASGLPLLGDGNSREIGAFAVFGMRLDFAPLGGS